MDQVATAAVSHRPEQRPAGVGGRIPRVDIAADLAPDEQRMPTAAHQAAHEDPRIAPQPCGPTQRLAAVGIGDDAGARLDEVEHDEFAPVVGLQKGAQARGVRSEEHTSELQSLMRISYAVFCLKKKKKTTHRLPA